MVLQAVLDRAKRISGLQRQLFFPRAMLVLSGWNSMETQWPVIFPVAANLNPGLAMWSAEVVGRSCLPNPPAVSLMFLDVGSALLSKVKGCPTASISKATNS